MKRIGACFLAAIMALTMGGCTASNEAYYERAQLYLGSGDFATAALLFSQLGEYADSADYALYCAGLDAWEDGNISLARANMAQVAPFKSSERYLQLLNAAELEENGSLEEALRLYTGLGSFEDSQERARHLMAVIPERDLAHARALMSAQRWEQAITILENLGGVGNSAELILTCQESIARNAYDQAASLYAQGQYEEALSAFEAMGDTMDARARALMCRGAMFRQLEDEYASATLLTAADLMERYAEMEDYLDSPARLRDLEARYLVNLKLLDSAYARPYVSFGSYPAGESGVEAPLLWRVTAADGAAITLLCEQVIDAMPIASATDLTLTLSPEEEAAAPSLALPEADALADLGSSAMACRATPYAMAQGVRHGCDGRAWWWLGNTLPDGRSPIVQDTGAILDAGVVPDAPGMGIRPMLTLSLEDYTFTQGSGTLDDPFR